jgi:hypothetical protein
MAGHPDITGSRSGIDYLLVSGRGRTIDPDRGRRTDAEAEAHTDVLSLGREREAQGGAEQGELY